MAYVAVTGNENHYLHDSFLNGFPEPENPSRLVDIMAYLSDSDVFDSGSCNFFQSDPASIRDILRVHTKEYIDFIRSCIEKEGKYFPNNVYLCEHSFDVFLHGVGCVLHAGDLVLSGTCDHSFALIRPPGHHAAVDSFSGFCIFNNSALLTRYLQEAYGLERIAIINIDAHASDGTYSIFDNDSSVLCISAHQDPSVAYPFKCFTKDIGVRPALGYSINMEMPAGSGNPEYAIFFDEVVEKVLWQFDPQVVLLECGFDAYYKDILSDLNLTIDGYYHIILKLASQWNVIGLLEGGYHDDLGPLVHVILSGMQGEKVIGDEVDQIAFLASRSGSTRKEFDAKLSRLKEILSSYWQLDDLDNGVAG